MITLPNPLPLKVLSIAKRPIFTDGILLINAVLDKVINLCEIYYIDFY